MCTVFTFGPARPWFRQGEPRAGAADEGASLRLLVAHQATRPEESNGRDPSPRGPFRCRPRGRAPHPGRAVAGPMSSSCPFATARPVVRPRRAVHVDLAEYGHAKVRHGLRPWQRSHRLLTVATDATAALLGLAAGLTVRTLVVGQDAALWGSTEAMQVTSVAIGVLWLVLLTRHGAYATRFMGAGTEEYRAVLRAAATLVAVVTFASFTFKLEFSRGVLVVAVPTMVVATTTGRHLLRHRLASARDHGRVPAAGRARGRREGRARAGPPDRRRTPHHRPRGQGRVRHRAVRPGARTRGVLRDPRPRRRGRHPRRGGPGGCGGGRRRQRPQPRRAAAPAARRGRWSSATSTCSSTRASSRSPAPG